MLQHDPTMAQRIAEAAQDFDRNSKGRVPASVAAVLVGSTLAIARHGVPSPAEPALSRTPEGEAQVREFDRQLSASGYDSLRHGIEEIMDGDVVEAASEVEPTTGAVTRIVAIGTLSQVSRLAHGPPAR